MEAEKVEEEADKVVEKETEKVVKEEGNKYTEKKRKCGPWSFTRLVRRWQMGPMR